MNDNPAEADPVALLLGLQSTRMLLVAVLAEIAATKEAPAAYLAQLGQQLDIAAGQAHRGGLAHLAPDIAQSILRTDIAAFIDGALSIVSQII